MWVLIERIVDGEVVGTLNTDPADMPLIEAGMPVRIPLTHVISTAFHKNNSRPQTPAKREYWDRCFVDSCVVEGRCHASYLYREKPDMTRDGDEYPDSGWRIRGTDEAIAEDEKRGRNPLYIAIGKVLNADDRWLHLLDHDWPCGFHWDPESQDYIEIPRE